MIASENGATIKRHNPVDSICRKIKTIQMRDQESNPTLQIPKFQSRSYDSPQTNLKKDFEVALKNRTVKVSEKNSTFASPVVDDVNSRHAQYLPPSVKWHADHHLTSVVASNKGRDGNLWPLCPSQSCSTPLSKRKSLNSTLPQTLVSSIAFQNIICEDRNISANHSSGSYVLDQKSEQDAFPSPVAKRLSLTRGGRGLRRVLESKTDMTEVSLICEEDLLDSIFHACDIHRRGKVAVSKIVDYLRHTTSRGSEDSGLDELCNMLDPEKKDISMDLDTYHAIMREWIEDCRNNGYERAAREETVDIEDSMFKLHESLIAVRRASGMNVTSGSLEALGGDVSKGDLETSDLITCVADLQFHNQKLQEQNCKLKMAMDTVEEVSNKLMEENEELHNQAKSVQQAIARAKSLKEELEEMKTNLNISEEKSTKILAQNKQLEKDNLSHIHKIVSLQEENIKGALDLESFRKKIEELSRINAELQVQIHEYENQVASKDTALHKNHLRIEELASNLMEYHSITETLRTEKAKLENSVQRMQQELISNGFNSSAACKCKPNIMKQMNSLLSELELAQHSTEVHGNEWLYSFDHTPLDETLDRQVLLLIQGPGQKQAAAELKTIIQMLQEATAGIADLVSSLQQVAESEMNQKETLEVIAGELKDKRIYWIEKLGLLEKHSVSLDEEFIRMAGNLRRTRTEQLHIKRELSSKLFEVETLKKLHLETAERADHLECQLQQATKQLEDAYKRVSELEGALSSAQEEADSLQGKLEEVITKQQDLRALNISVSNTCQVLQQKEREQLTAIHSLREKLSQGQLCELCKKYCCKRFPIQDCRHRNRTASYSKTPCWYNRLVDALTLEGVQLGTRLQALVCTCIEASAQYKFETVDLRKGCVSDNVLLNIHKCSLFSSIQTDVDLPYIKMETLLSKENIKEQSSAVEFPSSDNLPQIDVHNTPLPILGHMLISSDTDHLGTISNQQTVPLNILKGDLENKEMKAGNEQSPEECVKMPSSEGNSTGAAPLPNCKMVRFDQNEKGSASEKETEAEFLRLSLGFTCDLITLDKRLRLEERSRDLAEKNLKKEITNCLKLLESLTPICEEDNQSQEIIKKLEKSLEFLNQHTARVARRAEMLGAIHQESCVSKAVEVMIQHVENLKRMYVKEHAELEELKEILQQNERSFGSLGEQDESQKCPSSLNSKAQLHEAMESDGNDDKLNRRSNSWRLVGPKQTEKRPPLQKFSSTRAWSEHEEVHSVKECNKVSLWASGFKTSFFKVNATLWISLLLVLFLAAFVSFLTGLSFQRHADAAPAGPGDAWTSLQQLLWPYTGLRHNGQPPV